MSDSGFRRWVGLGVLASAMAFGAACNKGEEKIQEEPGRPGRALPEAGRSFEGRVNEAQPVESFGQEQQPATGGSGQQGGAMQQTQGAQPASPQDAQRMGPEAASGAQGRQGGIGAPGYSTPQETGTPGTGVTGSDTAGMGGTSAPGTRTESGGMKPGNPAASDDDRASDLGPGTPLGDKNLPQNQQQR